jgi:hypothetical protein
VDPGECVHDLESEDDMLCLEGLLCRREIQSDSKKVAITNEICSQAHTGILGIIIAHAPAMIIAPAPS